MDLSRCANMDSLFYKPSLESYLGDSLSFFAIKKTNNLSFRLDDFSCRKDSCSYYIFNVSQFGIHNDSLMSLRYYTRTKKWAKDDVVINCDFIQNFETNDNKSSGYFKILKKGNCPIMVKNQTDSCSYQNMILHVDSTIYFERLF